MMSEKIRIGILGAADIAARRFLPALKNNSEFVLVGIAGASDEERGYVIAGAGNTGAHKAAELVAQFGGKVYDSYTSLLEDPDIDAVYIPLPPSLHFAWAMKAIEKHKSVYLEKPCTTCYHDTVELLEKAKQMKVAVFENYVFEKHPQFEYAKKLVNCENLAEDDILNIGKIRQIRGSFGFPYRGERDFRYNKSLGGGAILDAGGYLLRTMRLLMGENIKIEACRLGRIKEHDVDGYGTALLSNSDGTIAVISFGMDEQYKCELELWGEKGIATFNRFYTPAPGFSPTLSITKGFDTKSIEIEAMDTFTSGIDRFLTLVRDEAEAQAERESIIKQARLLDELMERGIYE